MIVPRIPFCTNTWTRKHSTASPNRSSWAFGFWAVDSWGSGDSHQVAAASSASDLEGPVSVLILVNPDSSLLLEPTSGTNEAKMVSENLISYRMSCSGSESSPLHVFSLLPSLPYPCPCLVPVSIRNAICAANFTDWIHLSAAMQRKHICLTLHLK